MLLLGLISLAMPLIASFAVETIVGMLLVAVAFSQGWSAFRGFSDGGSPWQETIMAVAAMAAGFIFLIHPMAGVMTLSIILAAYFMADGITKIIEYFRVREIEGSVWILISGFFRDHTFCHDVEEPFYRSSGNRYNTWHKPCFQRDKPHSARKRLFKGLRGLLKKHKYFGKQQRSGRIEPFPA